MSRLMSSTETKFYDSVRAQMALAETAMDGLRNELNSSPEPVRPDVIGQLNTINATILAVREAVDAQIKTFPIEFPKIASASHEVGHESS